MVGCEWIEKWVGEWLVICMQHSFSSPQLSQSFFSLHCTLHSLILSIPFSSTAFFPKSPIHFCPTHYGLSSSFILPSIHILSIYPLFLSSIHHTPSTTHHPPTTGQLQQSKGVDRRVTEASLSGHHHRPGCQQERPRGLQSHLLRGSCCCCWGGKGER